MPFRRFNRSRFRRFRPFKRSFGRFRFRRLNKMSRMMTKRKSHIETKFQENGPSSSLVATGFTASGPITPTSILNGSERDERIGNRIKFLRCSLKFHTWVPSVTANTTLGAFGNVRLLILNPRLVLSEFNSYVATLNAYSFIDPSVATVMFDRLFQLSNPVAVTGAGNVPNTSYPSSRMFTMYFKFPRTVTFRDGVDTVLNHEDNLYFVMINGVVADSTQPETAYRWSSKTSWVDL